MIDVLIHGCHGRMGKVLENYIHTTNDIVYRYGIDIDTKLQFDSIAIKPDVIVDFSSPKGTLKALEYATANAIPIVIATTGFSKEELEQIKESSKFIPIFHASNMSYSIYLMSKLVSVIAPYLSNTDIEIIEKHHNKKSDAPSGTALSLANSINNVCENRYTCVFNRFGGKQSRKKNEIGFSSVRGGNLVGEHEVLFIGDYETIEIKHTAYSRDIYAEGAIRAARFILTKKKGLYGMEDLLD